MIKKKLLSALCITSIYATHPLSESDVPAKILQLYQLQDIAQRVNHIKPIGCCMLTVSPFVELTPRDIELILAGIPSDATVQRGRKQIPVSVLDYIKHMWAKVVDQTYKHKTITPVAREQLIEIRAMLERALHHNLLNTVLRSDVRSFLERQAEQHNLLNVSHAPTIPLFALQSAGAVPARDINRGIIKALTDAFSEQAVLERLSLNQLDQRLDLSLIIQAMITEDSQAHQMIVSGVSCSYDALSNTPHVVTVRSTFGDAKALEDATIASDMFYVHDETVYPIIRSKPNRMVPDEQLLCPRLVPNPSQIQNEPTLSASAVLELARATKLLEEVYHAPVCINFIKRDNTIYLLKVYTADIALKAMPSFFDPLYINKISPENKIDIVAVKPWHSLVVLKEREKVILAPDVHTFFRLLNERKKPGRVKLGIIKEMPPTQSKQARLLEELTIPVIWTPQFEQLRSWIGEEKYPLVFDIQHQIAFNFSRCRGFCTLFQGVEKGISTHPLAPQISVFPEFLPPIHQGQRDMFKPDEHFSGVTLSHLFDLLKFGSFIEAESALNTILFRLQRRITFEYITKKECAVSLQPYDTNRCERLEQWYAYVERIAYQLETVLKRQKDSDVTHADRLEKIFLIHMLQAVITQQPDEHIINSGSFIQLAEKI